MLKAIVRTVGVFGTIFAAGYVAQRYFGWDAKGLLNKAKNKLDEFSPNTEDKFKHSLKDTSSRQAM